MSSSQNSDIGDSFYGSQLSQHHSSGTNVNINVNSHIKASKVTFDDMGKRFYNNSTNSSNDIDTSIILPLQPIDVNTSFDLSHIPRQLYPETPYDKGPGHRSLLQTARGGEVIISDDARRKSLAIFQETTSVAAITSSSSSSSSSSMKPSLLQTARGGQVFISDEARRKSLSILQDTSLNMAAETVVKPSLLQTARGGAVTISDEARRKSLSILQDTPLNLATIETVVKPSLLRTARGGTVTISDEARRKSLSILQDTPVSMNTFTITTETTMKPSLLQTARGGTVTISEEARRKSLSVLESNAATPKPQPIARRNTISSNMSIPLVTPSIKPNSLKENNTNTSLKRSLSVSAKFVTPATKKLVHYPVSSSTLLNRVEDSIPIDMSVSIDRSSLISQSDQFIDRYIDIKQAREERVRTLLMIDSHNAQYVDFDVDDKLVISDNSLLLKRASDFILKNSPFPFSVAPINEDRSKWLSMQMRWIVWTLASHERKMPLKYLGSLLTSGNIFNLMNHRYTMYTGCYRNLSTDIKTAPNYGFSMGKADLLNILLRSKAVRHFNRTGSQSALQRCSDIGVLLNPMVLCFSSHGDSYEVTDGWWWAKASLDSDLKRLVEKKTLCDGVKIAVLSAAFELEGSSFTMKLFYNSVKKAKGDAPLGYMRPRNITGLSLPPLSANGGNVALAHVKLLFICSPMAKVQKRYGDSNNYADDKRPSSLKHLTMDTSELVEYRRLVEKRKESLSKEVENHEDLQLENLLEDVCDDENIITIIKNNAAGYDVHIEESQQREIARVISKVRQLQQDTAAKLMNQKLADLNSEESIYVDALVRDIRSQTLAWIRCMIQKNDTEKITEKMSVFSSFPLGSVIALSNINKMRPSMCTTPLFTLRSNSSCRLTTIIPAACNLSLGQSNVQIEPIESLRATIETPWGNYSTTCSTKPGSEITLSCKIIGWRKIYENDEPYVEITALDKSRVTAIVLYPYDNNSNADNIISNITTDCGLRWLNKGENILILLGVVRDVDTNYDIVRILRHDRTIIKSAPSNNININSEICDDEVQRYMALCDNKVTFRTSADNGSIEYYCNRFQLFNARIIFEIASNITNVKNFLIKVTDGVYTYEMVIDITNTPLNILNAVGIKLATDCTYATIDTPKYNEVFDIVYMKSVSNDINDKNIFTIVHMTLLDPDQYLKRIKATKKL